MNNDTNVKYTIITGDPVSGITHYGVFETSDEAIDAAELLNCEWWIAQILPTKELC